MLLITNLRSDDKKPGAAVVKVYLMRRRIEENDLENTVEYCYNDVTGKQVIEYIETYLASDGFMIDDDQEIFGIFRFSLSNTSTGEWVIVSYHQNDKSLFVTVGK